MASKGFPNKYASACRTCGLRVEIAAGLTRRGEAGEPNWVVTHKVCPQEAPEARTQPSSAQVSFTPTAEQAEVIRLFATGRNLVIQAGAGAGKTSTLKLLALQAWANNRKGQYVAYNKKIVLDVGSDMAGNVGCNTMHSLAHAVIGHQFAHRLPSKMGRQTLSDVAKLLGIRSTTIGQGEDARSLASVFLASKVLATVDAFTHSADAQVEAKHVPYVEGIDEPTEEGERTYALNNELAAHLVPFARKAWADMTNLQGSLRITHDTYLKLWSLSDPVIDVDFILLDEAQDADPVQVEIVKAQAARGVQIVCVGDEQQVLYAWRGAVDALGLFEAGGAEVAFLSQSFRFGDAIAEVANTILERLDARLRVRGFGPVASTVGPVAEPAAVLTRTNAGAVRTLLAAVLAGRRVHLVGGVAQIVSFCKAALALQQGRTTLHPELAMFDSWAEVVEYSTEEHGADLALNVKLITQFGAQEIIDALDSSEDEPATKRSDWDGLVISTAHKAKGLQWPTVQIAGDFVAPKDGSPLSAAELRLAYVACTRAQRELDITAVPHFLAGQADLDA